MLRRRGQESSSAELVMVVAEQNRGWVLDGICRDTAAHLKVATELCYDVTGLPKAPAYLFSHWSLYLQAQKGRRIPEAARSLVYFTHPSHTDADHPRLVRALSSCHQVLSMASIHARQLESWGVPNERVTTVLGAADPDLFVSHRRGGGAVGFVSAYYERKSPARLFGLARALPDREFLLLGRGWDHPDVAPQVRATPNLQVIEAPYREYPKWYGQMDVFVSPSTLEGGPIPLIEAMMSNVVPVATATGFCPDIIQNGVDGYLCETGAAIEEIARLVEQAFTNPTDVRPSVEHLTWERYAHLVERCLAA